MAVQVAPLVMSLLQLALDRKKSKEEKKEAVKQAAVDTVGAVIEGKKTTAIAVAGGVSAMAFDVAQYMPLEYADYTGIVNAVIGLVCAGLLLWNKKKDESK